MLKVARQPGNTAEASDQAKQKARQARAWSRRRSAIENGPRNAMTLKDNMNGWAPPAEGIDRVMGVISE